MMTEEKLYERLMAYKKKHGVTQEIYQHYKWAIETVKKQQQIKDHRKEEQI